MHKLFPDIRPNAVHHLPVSDGHVLYVEESGNPRGIPVLFVHGGPGSGCEDYHRCYFDPTAYRIILFDQRGAGRSKPHASLQGNTTQKLVEDMEAIRDFLGVRQWVLFGGSWGSTLSLVYAEAHPARVSGLILRGIFLCRSWEIRWFYQEGANRIFPDYWEDFIAPIAEPERGDLLRAHYRLLVGSDEVGRMASAKAWSTWEGRTSTLHQQRAVVEHFGDPHVALSLARIEAHYFMHDSFLEPEQILRDADRLQGIPGYIVHGRYDIICPLQNAWELRGRWPEARLAIVGDAGHSAREAGNIDALVEATQQMRHVLASA